MTMPKPHIFTMREVRYIESHWRTMTDRALGEALGLSKQQIHNYRHRAGLVGKPRETYAHSMFHKGHTPHNKGKRHAYGGKETRFHKGQKPHNTRHEGAYSIRRNKDGTPYIYVRVDEKWEYLHRQLWAMKRGPIPPGMIIVFRDGDTMNVRLDNLEMITRAENMRRNYNRRKAAATFRQTWQREKTRLKYGLPPQTGLGRRIQHQYQPICPATPTISMPGK